MSNAPIDTWDLVRAWGYEVVHAESIDMAAYVVDGMSVVIVSRRLPPRQARAAA